MKRKQNESFLFLFLSHAPKQEKRLFTSMIYDFLFVRETQSKMERNGNQALFVFSNNGNRLESVNSNYEKRKKSSIFFPFISLLNSHDKRYVAVESV